MNFYKKVPRSPKIMTLFNRFLLYTIAIQYYIVYPWLMKTLGNRLKNVISLNLYYFSEIARKGEISFDGSEVTAKKFFCVGLLQ